jgi:hypothetical protein
MPNIIPNSWSSVSAIPVIEQLCLVKIGQGSSVKEDTPTSKDLITGKKLLSSAHS